MLSAIPNLSQATRRTSRRIRIFLFAVIPDPDREASVFQFLSFVSLS